MDINEVSGSVIDAALKVHRRLGPGLLESVYERVLAYELEKRNLHVARQVVVPVVYDELTFDEGFRADLIVQHAVIVELKSVERLVPAHAKQLLTYLRLTNLKVGLLVNFNETLLKNGIRRIVNGLERP